jgi:hypothetical protein
LVNGILEFGGDGREVGEGGGGVGRMAEVEMASLSESAVFLELKTELLWALRTGALSIMCDEFGSLLGGAQAGDGAVSGGGAAGERERWLVPTSAQRFLDIVGVGVGDVEQVFEAVVEQHWIGAFSALDQVCAGFVRDQP